jgi:hypothetical protein
MLAQRMIAWITFSSFLAGCLGCIGMRLYAGLSPVLASALVGLLATFLPDSKKRVHAAVYAGTFAGMGSLELLTGPVPILILSVAGAGVFVLTISRFDGIGGKLGAIAFVASAILYGLYVMIQVMS